MLADQLKPKPGGEELYHSIIRNLQTCLHPARLLDIGCALGHFTKYARDRGWDAKGVECSPLAANFAAERFGLKVFTVPQLAETGLPDSHYDACVLLHVLAHLSQPRDIFREVHRLLKPGGIVYITTPQGAGSASLEQTLTASGFVEFLDLTGPLEIGHTHSGVLAVWARKPRNPYDPVSASMRDSAWLARLEGRLVKRPGATTDDQRVFLVRGRRKYWVTSPSWLHARKLTLDDVLQVPHAEMDCLIEGPHIR